MQISSHPPDPASDNRTLLPGLPPADELRARIGAGARCVRFECCFSFLVVTVRRQSAVYLTDSWDQRYLRGLGYSALAVLCGPWGVPWGLIWTPWAVWVNATGGVDVTDEVLAQLPPGDSQPGESAPSASQPRE